MANPIMHAKSRIPAIKTNENKTSNFLSIPDKGDTLLSNDSRELERVGIWALHESVLDSHAPLEDLSDGATDTFAVLWVSCSIFATNVRSI